MMIDAELRALCERHELHASVQEQLLAVLAQAQAHMAPPDQVSQVKTVVEASWPPQPPQHADYRCEELLGVGGVGEVWRVYDPRLRRRLALKVLRPHLSSDPIAVARFQEEARLTAQLQHPGIVSVHASGMLADGRHYFTMAEVAGRTLSEVIQKLHRVSSAERWGTTPARWTLRQVVSAFRQVCQAVAYAHGRGVLHRDLKPGNVMLGRYGEVLVLDWGLARVDGRTERAPDVQVRSQDKRLTAFGAIPGTPSYMSPEQISGDPQLLTPASDVYALGAILYELLCGQPPYNSADADAVTILQRCRSGPPLRPSQVSNGSPVPRERHAETSLEGPPIPEDLEAICIQAMAREPAARFQNADDLARAVSAWLDGEQRHERAERLVAVALRRKEAAASRRAQVRALRQEATDLLSAVRVDAPVSQKRDGWALQDRAEVLERAADLLMLEYVQTLRAALLQAPDHPDALSRLAEHYAAQHREAEAARDQRRADAAAVLLRSYDRGRYRRYLSGDGSISLQTEPPGATARLYRYVQRERRLVPSFTQEVGPTPLLEVPLRTGSYLVELQAPGRARTRFPIQIDRMAAWNTIPPGEDAPRPVLLLPAHALSAHECYVPAGWFWCGGDASANEALPRQRVWLEGFVMRRFPVTNAEYMDFLNDLIAQGREAEALAWAPRERAGTQGVAGALIYGRAPDGRFQLVADTDGDTWRPRWPVLKVDWDGAAAFARWYARRTGQPWRLPAELEWEKAARGVDGRFYPWGDTFDPSFCCMQQSHPPDKRLPAEVSDFPIDTSPYGVRGMAGNARDWCADPWSLSGPAIGPDGRALPVPDGPAERRVCRGGAWWQRATFSRAASRLGARAFTRDVGISFRLVRSV